MKKTVCSKNEVQCKKVETFKAKVDFDVRCQN